MRRQLWWIGALTLLWALICFAPDLLGWDLMAGFSGMVVKFFLGYCAIILVAQVFSALAALRNLIEELTAKERVSRRVMLR